MSNLLYGGISYPNTSFCFDRVYSSFKEASESVNAETAAGIGDGVLLNRYILICYSEKALSQNVKHEIEQYAKQGVKPPEYEGKTSETEGLSDLEKSWLSYYECFVKDDCISYDRHAMRKIYNISTEKFEYEDTAILNTNLDLSDLPVNDVKANDLILALDKNKHIQSALSMKYNDRMVEGKKYSNLQLLGQNDKEISSIDLIKIFQDKILTNDTILKYNEQTGILSTNLKLEAYDGGIRLYTLQDDNETKTQVADLSLTLNYNTDIESPSRQYIELKNDDIVIASFDASAFVKDSFLKDVNYDTETHTLTFTFITYDITTGAEEDKQVAINNIDIMDPGNGIIIDGNVISAKVSGKYLAVDERNGIHTTEALDTAITNAKEQAINSTKNSIQIVNSYEELQNGINIGDIGIVKTTIINDKISYTAYTWNGTTWVAMDGNYDATNIYFDDDIMVTKEIGYITLTNGNGYIPSKGKNLVEVFDAMFVKEQDPSKTEPSVSITLNKAGSYEVGETVTGITCTVSFDDGAYSYGPEPTGVEVNSWEIIDSNSKTHIYSASAISIPDVLVTDDTYYTITAKATHSAGDIPKTNKGNDCIPKQIAEGAKSKTSAAITGYRYAFAGGTDQEDIDSSIVRNIMNAKTNSKASMDSQNEALEFSAHKGDTKVFFAYPATWEEATPYFEIFGLAWGSTDGFVRQDDIDVADARDNDGYTKYNLYVWEPGGGALTADETKFRVWFK